METNSEKNLAHVSLSWRDQFAMTIWLLIAGLTAGLLLGVGLGAGLGSVESGLYSLFPAGESEAQIAIRKREIFIDRIVGVGTLGAICGSLCGFWIGVLVDLAREPRTSDVSGRRTAFKQLETCESECSSDEEVAQPSEKFCPRTDTKEPIE